MRRWRNTNNHGDAKQPPVPIDARKCRWCPARLTTTVLSPAIAVCPNGCRQDQWPLSYRCEDCWREFYTGLTFRIGEPRLCWLCEAADEQRHAVREQHEGGAPVGFLKDEIGRGASRRAFEKRGVA